MTFFVSVTLPSELFAACCARSPVGTPSAVMSAAMSNSFFISRLLERKSFLSTDYTSMVPGRDLSRLSRGGRFFPRLQVFRRFRDCPLPAEDPLRSTSNLHSQI